MAVGGDQTFVARRLRYPGAAILPWRGEGAVELLDHDSEDFVLLLERLDADRDLSREPIDTAVTVAGGLLRRLAVPAPTLHRSLAEQAQRWCTELPAEAARLGNVVPSRMVDQAVALCRDLRPAALMVNEDLHYLNVLRGTRLPWLVIDPKVLTGDPEFGVIPLLRNRFHELDGPAALRRRLQAIADGAGLNLELTMAWTFVAAIDDWLYFLPDSGPDATIAAAIAAALSDDRG